jgi:hypothetical protein
MLALMVLVGSVGRRHRPLWKTRKLKQLLGLEQAMILAGFYVVFWLRKLHGRLDGESSSA